MRSDHFTQPKELPPWCRLVLSLCLPPRHRPAFAGPTFSPEFREAIMQTLWAERFAQRTQRMKSSAVRELLKLTELPEIISFAGGLPAHEMNSGSSVSLSSSR